MGTILHLLDRFWQAELSSVSCRAGLKPDLALLEGLEPTRPRWCRGTSPAGVKPGAAELGLVLPNLGVCFEVIILILNWSSSFLLTHGRHVQAVISLSRDRRAFELLSSLRGLQRWLRGTLDFETPFRRLK